MEFTSLTDEQRRAFDADGFLVVRNMLDAETVAAATEAGDRLAAAFLRKPQLPEKPEYNHLDLRPGLFTEEPLLKLVSHPATVSLMTQFLSPNIHLHSTALIYKRPSRPTMSFRRGWHRDIRIPKDLGHNALPRVGIKICYCLTSFPGPNTGVTLLTRGTHLRNEPLRVPKGGIDPEGVEIAELTAEAGDAFLFDNRLYHTASPNLSDRTSKVVIYGYAYRWMKPEIYLDAPDSRLLAPLHPIARQLLGGYRDIDTPPWALQRWAKRNGALRPDVPWTVDA